MGQKAKNKGKLCFDRKFSIPPSVAQLRLGFSQIPCNLTTTLFEVEVTYTYNMCVRSTIFS